MVSICCKIHELVKLKSFAKVICHCQKNNNRNSKTKSKIIALSHSDGQSEKFYSAFVDIHTEKRSFKYPSFAGLPNKVLASHRIDS